MNIPADRKKILLATRDDIMAHLRNAQTDVDAVDRLISIQKEIGPSVVTASVGEIRQVAIKLLKENEKPVYRQTLLDQISESDIYVGGKIPVNNLGAILSRFDKDFKLHGQEV